MNDTKGISVDEVISLSLFNFRFENLDTVGYPLDIFMLQSYNPFVLNHSTAIGVGDKPLRLQVQMRLSVKGDSLNIYNKFDMILKLSNPTVLASMIAKVDEGKFLSFHYVILETWTADLQPYRLLC